MQSPLLTGGGGYIAAIFFAASVIYGYRTKRKGFSLYIAAVLCTLLSVFFMTFFLGNYQVVRAQLVYPFVFAFVCAALVFFPYKNKITAVVLICIMLITVGRQLKTTNLYCVSMYQTAQNDVYLARKIYTESEKFRDPSAPEALPFVFVGSIENRSSLVLPYRWDALGLSFFQIDANTVNSTIRITRFMNALGLLCVEPSIENYEYGVRAAEGMPSWPQEGSVKLDNGIIIVKLSEP